MSSNRILTPSPLDANVRRAGQMLEVQQSVDQLRRLASTPAPWQYPTLINSWVNYDTDRVIRYYKDSGRVYLEGIIKTGTINTVAFVLPDGYRPTITGSGALNFPCAASAAFGIIAVFANGNVTPSNGTNTWVDLSGVSFRCVA